MAMTAEIFVKFSQKASRIFPDLTTICHELNKMSRVTINIGRVVSKICDIMVRMFGDLIMMPLSQAKTDT